MLKIFENRLFVVLWLFSMILISSSCEREDEKGVIEVGAKAPDIELSFIDDAHKKLSEYRGALTLLFFWSPSCGKCQEDLPYLDQLHLTYQEKGFTVIGIHIGGSKHYVVKFLKKNNMHLHYPMAYDPIMLITEAFNVQIIPTVFLLDREFRFLEITKMPETPGDLEKKIVGYLG